MPKVSAGWHRLQVAGTGGKFMPVWQAVHGWSSWVLLSTASLPLWQSSQVGGGVICPLWCGLPPGSTIEMLVWWQSRHVLP